jgi:hypothetical protein
MPGETNLIQLKLEPDNVISHVLPLYVKRPEQCHLKNSAFSAESEGTWINFLQCPVRTIC